MVMELVGLQPALKLGFDLLRPGGVLVSLGVHHEGFPWTPAEGMSFIVPDYLASLFWDDVRLRWLGS
jgi:threonine dehydrogenase-like Zn-dependent dehydrogenase